MKKTALVIMAAGIGSRYGNGIKQLAPVGPHQESTGSYDIAADGTAVFTAPKKSAKAVSVPDTITVGDKKIKVTAIADKAFYKNKKLTKITIGANIKTIGRSAFEGCAKLKTVKGGSGVVTIKDSAFKGCKKLTAITLGKKVKSIGKKAFYGCKALKTITVKTAKLTGKNVGASAFKGIAAKATFKCPKKQRKAYRKLFKKKGAPKSAKYR